MGGGGGDDDEAEAAAGARAAEVRAKVLRERGGSGGENDDDGAEAAAAAAARSEMGAATYGVARGGGGGGGKDKSGGGSRSSDEDEERANAVAQRRAKNQMLRQERAALDVEYADNPSKERKVLLDGRRKSLEAREYAETERTDTDPAAAGGGGDDGPSDEARAAIDPRLDVVAAFEPKLALLRRYPQPWRLYVDATGLGFEFVADFDGCDVDLPKTGDLLTRAMTHIDQKKAYVSAEFGAPNEATPNKAKDDDGISPNQAQIEARRAINEGSNKGRM